ncbi:MAG TPA: glycosyltransferase family 2 protein, partial [Anaerolinea sp.]|nr:glycosyltransferase family 2 protein [Anaerolinea sp.]
MTSDIVSIILPVRNEEKYIGPCLDQVFNQVGFDGPVEVIVADGMSTDRTREIVRQYQEKHPNLILVDNPGKIVPIGMNLALRQANGEIIIRVDGHCIIAQDYLQNCVNHLLQDGVDGVGVPMQTIAENHLSEVIAIAMSSIFGVGNSAFRTTNDKTMLVDSVPFPAYTRAIIQKAGPYDEELVRNQDDEYNYRIRELGGKILLAGDVRSTYYSRGSLQKLWMQYFQYGYWKVRVLQKHPRQMSLRQFIPPAFVASLLLSIILTIATHWGWFALALVVGSYLLANLTASMITAGRKGIRYAPLLPLTFAIL